MDNERGILLREQAKAASYLEVERDPSFFALGREELNRRLALDHVPY